MRKPPALKDTADLVGGPFYRYGGKAMLAGKLLPHFARTIRYVEPFFGAGGMFFRVPEALYKSAAVNDLDRSLVTFFRVLRERPAELAAAIEATPFALDELAACCEPSDDPLEEARRVWVRARQAYPGNDAVTAGRWYRHPDAIARNDATQRNENKLAALRRYAARLRRVYIDNIDAVKFVEVWGQRGTMVYADPPYVLSERTAGYRHEMDDAHHERLAAALHTAARGGAYVAISGYPSALYQRLYGAWRRVDIAAASTLAGMRAGDAPREEVLWLSYPASCEIGPAWGARHYAGEE